MNQIIKVATKSTPKSVAGAIASMVRENKNVEVQAIGAGAVNQAVKSIAIARSYLTLVGTDIAFAPSFESVDVDGTTQTAIKMKIHKLS